LRLARNSLIRSRVCFLLRSTADFGHAEGCLGLMARGSSVHAEAHRSEATLSC